MGNVNEGEEEKKKKEINKEDIGKHPSVSEGISNGNPINKKNEYNNLVTEEKSKQSHPIVSNNPQANKTREDSHQINNNLINYRENFPQPNYNLQQNFAPNNNPQNNNYNINQIGNQHNYNHVMYILNLAQNSFHHACELKTKLSYSEALAKLDEAYALVISIYSCITDQILKTKVDNFLKSVNDNINHVNSLLSEIYRMKPICTNRATYNQNEIKEIFNKNVSEKKYVVRDIKKSHTPEPNFSHQKDVQRQNFPDNQKEINAQFNNKNSFNDKKQPKSSSEKSFSNIPSDLLDKIYNEILDNKPNIKFEDVIGLESAKQTLKEIIVLPNLRPDLFTGLRSPPRGLLLFGPPGTGKTMIAKAVATECNCTFFSISASSLTSKYLGESEKLVKALFHISIEKQPSVIFIDEIDSILSKRSEGENDAVKRLKTEFLVQFDGVGSDLSAKVLVIGATNRPFELDNAVLRRLPKKIYIGPFNLEERIKFIEQIMKNTSNDLSQKDYKFISQNCENYSNSDLKELCKEAAYEPIRDCKDINKLKNISKLRNVNLSDFKKALRIVRGTLSKEILRELTEWNKSYGAID